MFKCLVPAVLLVTPSRGMRKADPRELLLHQLRDAQSRRAVPPGMAAVPPTLTLDQVRDKLIKVTKLPGSENGVFQTYISCWAELLHRTGEHFDETIKTRVLPHKKLFQFMDKRCSRLSFHNPELYGRVLFRMHEQFPPKNKFWEEKESVRERSLEQAIKRVLPDEERRMRDQSTSALTNPGGSDPQSGAPPPGGTPAGKLGSSRARASPGSTTPAGSPGSQRGGALPPQGGTPPQEEAGDFSGWLKYGGGAVLLSLLAWIFFQFVLPMFQPSPGLPKPRPWKFW